VCTVLPIIHKKRRGVNPSCYTLVQLLKVDQSILVNVFYNRTSMLLPYILVDNMMVVCYHYPYHRSDIDSPYHLL